MKLSLSAFLVTLTVAHAADLPQTPRHRELVDTGPIDFVGSGCYDYTPDGTWTELFRNDDSGLYIPDIGIDFPWVDGFKNDIYINTNGNLSFDGIISSYQPTGFSTTSTNMIAPFWADVDTRGSIDGYVWYKSIPGSKFIVTWEEVARYGADPTPRRNTFQVVLSDASQAEGHICFCYGGMDWVLGTATNTGQAQVGIAGGAGNTFNLAQFSLLDDTWNGIGTSDNGIDYLVDKSFCFDSSAIDTPPDEGDLNTDSNNNSAGSNGDPHFKTWQNEHFEFHGQCDLILAKDDGFANGIGLNVQIRTKLVRFWSYIKSAALLIGDDVLEVQGTNDIEPELSSYWINFQYRAEPKSIGGFPLTIYDDKVPVHPKRRFEIDLNSKYPGQKIIISTFKEFVKVDFLNPSAESFGNAVGMLGDFKSGKTLSRDQATVIHDFNDYGVEWQVLPADNMLFHDLSHPQFPEPCVLPEDPRGQRRRHLGEQSISLEQAEATCGASLSDPLDVKDCVYDIMATQDLDMVGAF